MTKLTYEHSQKLINLCLFFVPALLLCTKNGSVFIIAILALYSILFIIKDRKNIIFTNFDWFIIAILSAYFIASIPVYLTDIDNARYFKGASRYIACIPIYFLVKTIIKETQKPRLFFEWGLIVGSIGTVIIALYQSHIEGRARVDGFLYSINFGYLACSLAFLCLTMARDSAYKYYLYIAFVISIYATSLTLTRGAIFAIPVLLTLTFIFHSKDNKLKRSLITVLTIGVIAAGVISVSPSIKSRITDENFNFSNPEYATTSMGIRLELWHSATKAFLNHPFTGLRYSGREALSHKLYQEGVIHETSAFVKRAHAHNQYFEMIASNGIWGILAIIMLLFAPMLYFLKNMHFSSFSYTGFIFVSGFSFFCLTEVPLEQNLIASFYACLVSIFIAFTEIDKKKSRNISQNNV